MNLVTEQYSIQIEKWPSSGRHILAQYDAETIVVYQAYRSAIGHFAAEHGYLGGQDFSLDRMSWIKTNFLWMMYRSGWGRKTDQEVTLAVWIYRHAFDQLLQEAVHSKFIPEIYNTRSVWEQALKNSTVRLQWDPDHDPFGRPLTRRAIQLGLRGDTLLRYSHECIVGIEDISTFVAEQAGIVRKGEYAKLLIPQETVYPILDETIANRIGITA